jgi:GEVED domain/HYR domain/CARDB/Domain of unknown function DUF11/Secretion system C-terminal sorting domain
MKRRNLYPLSILALLAMLFPHFGFVQNQPTLVKDINVGTGSSSPFNFSNNNGKLNFSVYFPTTPINYQNWESDGTSNGTKQVTAPTVNQPNSVSLKGSTYVFDNSVFDTIKLLKKEANGSTTLIKKIDGHSIDFTQSKNIYGGQDWFYFITAFGDTTGLCCGQRDRSLALWRSDGTAAGTSQIKVISTFGLRSTNNFVTAKTVNNTIYLLMQESEVYQALYACDGTATNYRQIVKDLYPNFINILDTDATGSLYYSKYTNGIGDFNFYKYSGNTITLLSNTSASVVNAGTGLSNAIIFASYKGVWITDGTVAGTKRVTDKNVLYLFKNTAGNILVLTSLDFSNTATELWHINEQGITKLYDIHANNSNGSNFAVIGNTLFFNGKDVANGEELWKVDLTNINTTITNCKSKGILPWEYWISNVKLGTINNTSDKFKDFNTLGYSNYTNLTTTLSKGQSYPLSISPGLSWIGNVPNAYARAWIDFNNNNIFETNELVLEKTNANPLIANVLVPTTAVTGNVRMRVSVKFGSYPTACETFEKGEVEDYIINISAANSNCPNIKFSLPSAFGDRTEYVPSNQTCKEVYWGMPRVIDSCVGIASERAILHSSVSNNTVIYNADFLSWACFPIGTTTISYNYGGNIYSFKVTVIQQSNDLPDLTLANLNLTNPSIQQGQDLFFKVDIKNIGNGVASGEVNVQTYVSTDNILSANDIALGGIIVLDVAAGTTRPQVGGVLTPTNDISVGQYYLILKVDGNERLTESNENNNLISIPFSVTTPQTGGDYCVSKGTAPWQEWISGVQLANINNTSQKEGYGNFTNLTATLAQGGLYPITITRGFSWATDPTNTTQKGIVWIDYNQNKTFEVSEIVATFTRNVITQSIFVPVGAKLGKTRMRVSFKTIGEPTSCEVFDKGEVEDYTVNISGTTVDPCLTDVTPPVFVNCPQNINLAISGTRTFATWIPPTATDNCTPNPTVTPVVANPPFSFGLGSTEISYNATDAKGNRATCRFNVVVTQSPTTILPDLTVSKFQFLNKTVKSGDSLKFNIDVVNNSLGGTPAGVQFFMRFYISTDNVLSANDIPANPYSIFADVIAQQSFTNLTSYITLPNGFAAGQYYLISKIDADNIISESNENNNVIVSSSLFTVSPTNTGGNDLALSITATPSVFRKYTTHSFRVTAQNVGNQALTNVKIELKRPTLTSNGGSKVASLGTFSDYCAGGTECSEWRIPSLAAGATATLDAPFFILDANVPIIATTKLLSSIPIDANSTNNIASVTVNPAPPSAPVLALSRPQPTQFIPLIVESISPNPTEGDLTIEVASLREQVVQFQFANAMGQVIQSEKRTLKKGSNSVQFDVWSLPQGIYFLQTDVNRGRISPTKFVKF